MKGKWLAALTLAVLPALTHGSVGQPANPEQLHIARGEANWVTPRGSASVSLEQCDLGEGPGKLEGAYAKLPRYFSDADRVMDLEQRLLWCMDKLQGLDTTEFTQRPFPGAGRISEMEDLVVFIAGKSNGMKIEPQTARPKEREALAAGEAMYYRRSATMDFSCDSCHGADGKRMRWARLPQLSKPGAEAQAVMGSWPVYGFPQHRIRTMQYRLWECYRQMRMPAPEYASDGLTALALFLANNATGGTIQVPSFKR